MNSHQGTGSRVSPSLALLPAEQRLNLFCRVAADLTLSFAINKDGHTLID